MGRYQSRLVGASRIGILATFRSRGLRWGPVDWREREANAAAVLRDCRHVLAARGSTILDEATEGAAGIAAWRRFPEGEVYDPASHAQYFYHCHSAPAAAETGSGERSEHGH